MKKSVKLVSALALAAGLGLASSAMAVVDSAGTSPGAEAVVGSPSDLPGTKIFSRFTGSTENDSMSVLSVSVYREMYLNTQIQTGPLQPSAGGVVTAIIQPKEASSFHSTPLLAKVTYGAIIPKSQNQNPLKCTVIVSSPNVNNAKDLNATIDHDNCSADLAKTFSVQYGDPAHPDHPVVTVYWDLGKLKK